MLGLGLDVAALARRGAGGAAAFDFAAGVLPPGASLTRGSSATCYTAGGLLTTMAPNVARFDHDPVSRQRRGLLIEDARSNDYAASEALDAAAWNKAAGNVGADALIAPDGVASADVFVPMPGSASHTASRAFVLTAGTSYVVSVFVKAAGYGFFQLYGNGGYGSFYLNVDVAAGVETAFAAGNSQVAGRSVRLLDNGWCRVAVALTATSSGTALLLFAPQSAGNATRAATSVGDGSSGIALWGAQHEAGTALTSYIATGAGTAARAADALVLDWGSRGVPDGAATIRYVFDDGSAQEVATTIAGGAAGVPTNLARRWLLRAERA